MKWIKKGLIFNVNGQRPWMRTHAALPFADHIKDDIYRIYFSTRDSNNRATPGYIQVNLNNPTEILELSNEPVLQLGNLGAFDENGVMPTSLVTQGSKKYMYYVGWNVGSTVPFRWSIGLAISFDNGRIYEKYSEGPIIDRNPIDPYLIASPTVILDKGLWKMWYISSSGWKKVNGEYMAPYQIKYTESNNGIDWKREGIVSIPLRTNETGIGRTTVIEENGTYKMWYPYSFDKYKIGYAESSDGKSWQRKDDLAGIDTSDSGWDSDEITYPFVFSHKGVKYMLYNGNNFGKTGFGYAMEES